MSKTLWLANCCICDTDFFCFADIKTAWYTAHSGIRSMDLFVSKCLARHEQTTIFRLRAAQRGLRARLKRIGIMDYALCYCKEAEQTVHHILQDCSIWRKQRHQLWPQDESTTTKLWRTAEDLRRTTQFLATCGLGV